MPHDPISLTRLMTVVDAPRAVVDLCSYFEPDRSPGTTLRCAGSRFEFLAGGGDRPEIADRITADDLVAVSLRSRAVPADVAVELLEGDLGVDVAGCLRDIPIDVAVDDPGAADHLGTSSPASLAWYLLEEPPGMDQFVVDTLLVGED